MEFIERVDENDREESLIYIASILEKLQKDREKNDEEINQLKKIQKLLKSKKYGLVWEEHLENVEEDMKHKIPIFKEYKKIHDDFRTNNYNFLLEGDNLHSLHLLEKTHKGDIDVIYIDPPYNTGNKDFIYNDDFVDKTNSFRHSKWLSFMERRLVIANKLLKDEGVIFISIDDNEYAQLKLLMDELFGEQNFIASIVRATNSSKNQSLFVSVSHEYCLIYAKKISKLSLKHKVEKWEVKKNNIDIYKKTISHLKKLKIPNEDITKELKELTKYPRFADFMNYWYIDDRGVYRKDNLGGVKNGQIYELVNPLTNKIDPVPPGGYRYSEDKMVKLIEDNRIHFHTDGSLPTIKRYLHENESQRPKSIMSDDQRPDVNMLKDFNIAFDNPKQMTFMKRILSIFRNDSLILDFFAGSGTTGQAVVELNKEDGGERKFILATSEENNIAENVTYKRMKKVSSGTDKYEAHPMNLKYFKTDFISKTDNDVENLLLKNIKTLVELMYGVDLEASDIAIVTSRNELKELNLSKIKTIYMRSQTHKMLDRKMLTELKDINIIDIPEKFFSKEMKEAGL